MMLSTSLCSSTRRAEHHEELPSITLALVAMVVGGNLAGELHDGLEVLLGGARISLRHLLVPREGREHTGDHTAGGLERIFVPHKHRDEVAEAALEGRGQDLDAGER